MRYCWLLLLLLGAATAGRAQPATSYSQLTKLVSPPGAVPIQDSLWMDETEVANIHWLEYLHFLRKDSSEAQYERALPDTAAWRQLSANDPYIHYYLRYPGFRYCPVVACNVAELTATPGVAKGGSFWHSIQDSTIPTSLPYTTPQMWLGFRYVCSVYIEPKK